MTQPFLKAYSELLIQTCHRRGAHAMGGMAAQIPISGRRRPPTSAALARVRADKLREVGAGHDGTWVAHPALIPLARDDLRRAHARRRTSTRVLRDDVRGRRRDDLLAAARRARITRAGFDNNVEVCVRYLAAWLDGNGCVPIHWLMEDAATAEIARAQLWQWLHTPTGRCTWTTAPPIDFALLERALIGLPARARRRACSCRAAAASTRRSRCSTSSPHATTLADFLTLPAYDRDRLSRPADHLLATALHRTNGEPP